MTTSTVSPPQRALHYLRARPVLAQAAVVTVLVLLLELLTFRGFFSGATSPQFDFMSAYNTEGFAWWRDGGIFAPPQWMSYMYGGYPALSNLQNGAYYLPVGLVAAVTPYTIHAAAALAAVHVAFGAVGVYVFARKWQLGITTALVGLVLWFFVSGFFASATYPDIMRAYAWIPWIMLVVSVKWNWRRPAAAVIAVLVLWQAIIAIYPGMLVALGYVLPVWILGNQIAFRPKLRAYLVPLAVVGVAALAMSMLKFLPAVLERGTSAEIASDTSAFNLASIGAFLFPYDNPVLPWFQTMRSFFLPAIALPLLAFVPLRDRLSRILMAVVVVVVAFGFPNWPWHDFLAAHLPGMDASRFRLNDFKVLLLFAICVLALAGLQRLVDDRRAAARTLASANPTGMVPIGVPTRRVVLAAGVLALLVAGFAVIGVRYGFAPKVSLVQWGILTVASVVLFLFWLKPRLLHPRALAAGLVVVAMTSGLVAAFAVPEDWRTSRPQAEVAYFGASVDSLIAERDAQVPDAAATQRPQRMVALPETPNEDFPNFYNGRVFYTGGLSVLGYANLRGTETYDLIKKQLNGEGETRVLSRAFWSAAGLVEQGEPDTLPSEQFIALCADSGACGSDLDTTPVEYDRTGHFVYDLTARADVPVMLNEAHYTGWAATLCPTGSDEDCLTVPTARGAFGQVTLDVPEGDWRLTLDYALPGQTASFWLFAGGLLVVAALTTVTVARNRRERTA